MERQGGCSSRDLEICAYFIGGVEENVSQPSDGGVAEGWRKRFPLSVWQSCQQITDRNETNITSCGFPLPPTAHPSRPAAGSSTSYKQTGEDTHQALDRLLRERRLLVQKRLVRVEMLNRLGITQDDTRVAQGRRDAEDRAILLRPLFVDGGWVRMFE